MDTAIPATSITLSVLLAGGAHCPALTFAGAHSLSATPTSRPCVVPLPQSWRTQLSAGEIRVPSGAVLNPKAVAPDGSRLFSEYYTSVWNGLVEIQESGSAYRYHRIFQLTGPEDQVLAAAFDGRWLVWTVTHAYRLLERNDWDLYARDSRSGALLHIASAPRVGGNPVPGPLVFPALAHGILAWTQSVSPGRTALHLYWLAQRHDRIVSEGHVGPPVFAWPWLVWQEASAPGERGSLRFASASTGTIHTTPTLLVGIRPWYLAGAAGMLAWIGSDYRSVWLWHASSNQRTRLFIGPKDDYMQFPALGRMVLVWYGVQSGYAADLRTGAVTRLRNTVVWLDARGHGLLMSYSIAKSKMYHPPTRVFLVKVDDLPPLPRCAGSDPG